MSGVEELVRRLLGEPYNTRPLKHKDDKIGRDGLTCPLDGSTSLGIDFKPHRDGAGDWIAVAWCNRDHSDIDAIARAVGMGAGEVHTDNRQLRHKYQPRDKPEFSSADSDVSRWTEDLWCDKALLRYLRQARRIGPGVIRAVRLGHDGERYTLPVYEDRGAPFGRLLIGIRRYLPNPPVDVTKMLSAPGSRAGLFPDIPSGNNVVLVEGEFDCLAARSIGLPAVPIPRERTRGTPSGARSSPVETCTSPMTAIGLESPERRRLLARCVRSDVRCTSSSCRCCTARRVDPTSRTSYALEAISERCSTSRTCVMNGESLGRNRGSHQSTLLASFLKRARWLVAELPLEHD
ncbi:MAG: hypothetical protein ABJD24_02940 [Acidimicrobiales bacterium]